MILKGGRFMDFLDTLGTVFSSLVPFTFRLISISCLGYHVFRLIKFIKDRLNHD